MDISTFCKQMDCKKLPFAPESMRERALVTGFSLKLAKSTN